MKQLAETRAVTRCCEIPEYIGTLKKEYIEITSWLVSAYDFYSRVVKDR